MSIYLNIYLYVYLSIYLSVYLPIYLSIVCIYHQLKMCSLALSLSLSLSLSLFAVPLYHSNSHCIFPFLISIVIDTYKTRTVGAIMMMTDHKHGNIVINHISPSQNTHRTLRSQESELIGCSVSLLSCTRDRSC